MNMRSALVVLGLAAALGPAAAGVITGTGAAPSSAVLGATDAVSYVLAEQGPGHALIVPYFTAQAGQMSVLHLVNVDTTNGKIVKLRYRGAGNGDSLFSMQVLLSPGDVWTAAVTMGSDGIAQITTADATCTYPALARGVAQPFSTDRLNPLWSAERRADNTREGMIEAIVAADIFYPANTYTYPPTPYVAPSALATAILQINGTAPCTPYALDLALSTDVTQEGLAAGRGFATPTGGVTGTWYVIDVTGSTTFSGAATALRAVNAAGKTARGNFVWFPQTDEAVAEPERFTADPLLVSAGLASQQKDASGVTSQPTTAAVISARSHDLPDLSTPYYLPASAFNARTTAGDVSRLLGVASVRNQYAVDPSISAKTDWTLSMPTKRYSVGYDYGQATLLYSVVPASGAQDFSSSSQRLRNEMACSWSDYAAFDRERITSPPGIVFEGYPGSKVYVCGVASVVAFADKGRSALSASVARDTLSSIYVNGWLSVLLPGGAPILGHSFIKLTNPNATPATVGNYGLTFPHMDSAP